MLFLVTGCGQDRWTVLLQDGGCLGLGERSIEFGRTIVNLRL